MSRIFILLGLVLFMSTNLCHAQEETTVQEYDSLLNSAISRVDEALTRVENGIEEFKIDVEHATNRSKFEMDKKLYKLRKFIDRSADGLENAITKYTNINLTSITCDLAGNFRIQAVRIFDDVQSCMNTTFDEFMHSTKRISNEDRNVRTSLQNLKHEIINCSKSAASISDGLSCVENVTSSVETMIDSGVTVTMKLATLATLMPKLKLCAGSDIFTTVRDHYKKVLSNLPGCIGNKITTSISNVWNSVFNYIFKDYEMKYPEEFEDIILDYLKQTR